MIVSHQVASKSVRKKESRLKVKMNVLTKKRWPLSGPRLLQFKELVMIHGLHIALIKTFLSALRKV